MAARGPGSDLVLALPLTRIIARGNRGHVGFSQPSEVACLDGFTLSVIAGGGTYCHPRPAMCFHSADHEMVLEPLSPYEDVSHDYPGPYDTVEVGFPSERPEPWDGWRQYAEESDEPTETVYGYVPVGMVRDLVELHGGEVGWGRSIDQAIQISTPTEGDLVE